MKHILTILLFFIGVTLSAQKLTVDSFTESVNDLSARTHPRSDLNGNVCALVKVQLAAQGASFEGNVVGDTGYSTSEYSVYMTQGSKKLTVKLEGYLPLTVVFDEYKIPALVSKTTYVLTITGVQTNGQPQEVRTKTGWIILDSEPQGASVYINGEYVGDTPLDSYKQPYGTYEYKLEKPNYHSASGSIDLNSAQFEKTVKLSPAFGSISVTSNISGAGVLLDGKSTGMSTPCTLTEIPSGSHIISLSKDKYAPRQYSITVEDGKETKVDGGLDARFASVTVKSLEGADIFIDGSRKGSGSCMLDLMEGYYDIETTLAHHRKATRQVQIIAGQPQTITLNPTPIYGSLDIISTPRRASIIIDGKQYGQTPYTVEQLLEGSHSVTLSLEGYAPETRTVTISDGQTATVSATLQNGHQTTISAAKRKFSGAELVKKLNTLKSTEASGLEVMKTLAQNMNTVLDYIDSCKDKQSTNLAEIRKLVNLRWDAFIYKDEKIGKWRLTNDAKNLIDKIIEKAKKIK